MEREIAAANRMVWSFDLGTERLACSAVKASRETASTCAGARGSRARGQQRSGGGTESSGSTAPKPARERLRF